MRDSINYNLNYFIMRMSGTKPMKNTMRKQSPLKFGDVIATVKGTTKPVEGKPGGAGAAARARAKAKASETSVKSTKPSPTSVKSSTETSAKAPTMQMKKSGMKKKC